MYSIVHMTTVHPRHDIRIRIKEAASLSRHDKMQVTVFVQDGKGSEKDESTGVSVVDTGPKPESRPARIIIGALRMWRAVRRAKPTVVHFHDSELIPVGLLLKFSGIKVFYDVHEDVPAQIFDKHYLPSIIRKPVARALEIVEKIAGNCFDAIIPATPKIAERFPVDKTVVVQNYPIIEELVAPEAVSYFQRPLYFAYLGGINRARGAVEMVEAINQVAGVDVKLCLAGVFLQKDLQGEIESLAGWKKIKFFGWLNRKQVAGVLGNVRAGLVLFHPGPNHCNAQPNKMFEYMAAGLPVIASDFPLWREMVKVENCGLLVDPLNPVAIAEAMKWILDNPQEAEAMGRRGRRAVEEKYNWECESEKLIALYERLLSEK